jgi:hypothetical protein
VVLWRCRPVTYTFVCGPLKTKETALEIMSVLATRTGGFMVQRDSGRFRQVRACRHARRSRTRITQGRCCLWPVVLAGRLMLSPTARPGGPCDWPQDRSWLVAPTSARLAATPNRRMRYAPSGQGWPSCLLSGRLPQLLASLPIVQNFLRFIFIQLIYPESASGHAPCCGGAPWGTPTRTLARPPPTRVYFQ